MPLNQIDLELEMVIVTIDSSTETDFGDYESGHEYSSGETTDTSNKTEACLQLERMRIVPNVEI